MIKIDELDSWRIQYQGLASKSRPVEYTKMATSVSFKILMNSNEEIEFVFPVYDKTLSLHGTYTVSPSGYTSSALMNPVEEGRVMKVSLQGNLSRFSFQLKRP